MTIIYTTKRCITVEEPFDCVVSRANLALEGLKFIQLTEVTTSHGAFPTFEVTTKKRQVVIQIRHIVEIIE